MIQCIVPELYYTVCFVIGFDYIFLELVIIIKMHVDVNIRLVYVVLILLYFT